jgi:hypothetical protein
MAYSSPVIPEDISLMQGDRFGKEMGYLPNSKLIKPIL